MEADANPLSRRLAAEALGTAILVATVVGSGIMAARLSGGNQALALLGNTIPTGAILVVIITILGPVSGAHFNPAVTLVFAARREFPWSEVAPYIVVQCLAGIVGTAIAHMMFNLSPLEIGTAARSGPGQWLGEAAATFTLLVAIVGGLVHLIDVVRQSGGDLGARLHHHVHRDRDQSRAGIRGRANRRGARDDPGVRGTVSAITGPRCRGSRRRVNPRRQVGKQKRDGDWKKSHHVLGRRTADDLLARLRRHVLRAARILCRAVARISCRAVVPARQVRVSAVGRADYSRRG
jgi:hypothetical protein